MRFQINPFTDKLDISGMGPGSTSVDFVTGNSGGQVAADAGYNINILGDNASGLDTIGNLSPNTLTIFGLPSSTTQIGTTRYATNAESAAQSIGTASLTPANITSLFSSNYLPSSQGGTGLSSPAAHSLLVTNGSSPYTVLGVAGNGQIPIGSIASDPVLNTITAGSNITITNGPGTITIASTGSVPTTFTEDSGSATPSLNNLNLFGSGSITTSGSGSTVTTTLTGLTNHSVLVGAGTSTITKLSVGTDGQVLIGATGADPAFATLTSSDSSISFTPGANSLSLQVAAGTGVVKTITGDTGGALSPTAGNINTFGSGSITIAGSGSTLTTQLTGLTNHALLVGAGTSTITKVGPTATAGQVLQSAGSSADPAFSTATYPATTTINQILYSSSNNTVSGLSTDNKAVLTTGATGIPVLTALATDGQLIIGSTSGVPAAATLTAGTGVSIVNASNSITVNAIGGGLSWTVVTGTTQSAAVNNGYIANNAGQVTITLPATSAVGDTVAVMGINNATGWKIAQNAGNQIFFGTSSTTSGTGGSLTSTATRDVVYLVCVVANGAWNVVSSIGNITVA